MQIKNLGMKIQVKNLNGYEIHAEPSSVVLYASNEKQPILASALKWNWETRSKTDKLGNPIWVDLNALKEYSNAVGSIRFGNFWK